MKYPEQWQHLYHEDDLNINLYEEPFTEERNYNGYYEKVETEFYGGHLKSYLLQFLADITDKVNNLEDDMLYLIKDCSIFVKNPNYNEQLKQWEDHKREQDKKHNTERIAKIKKEIESLQYELNKRENLYSNN